VSGAPDTLQYLTYKILDIAGTVTQKQKRQRITPRHIAMAIRADADMDDLLQTVITPQSRATMQVVQNQTMPSAQ
jgi:hypothetical protein